MLSIIIVNWNSKDYVRECLRSLEKHVTLTYETIVVDGASFDGCGEMLAAEFPAVRFVQSPSNVGFGRCNNLGAQHAFGEHLLFLNPDTVVTQGALEALLAVATCDSDVGLVGARLLNTDGTLQTSSVQALPTPLNQGLDSNFLRGMFPRWNLWGTHAAYTSTKPVPVEAVSGACMLIPRELFSRLGGFSPHYFMYAEDMHLCWDVSKFGKRVVYQPAANIIHHGGGASAGDFSQFSCLEMRRAVHRFITAREGPVGGFAYRVSVGASAVGRLALLATVFALAAPTRRAASGVSIKRWWSSLRWSAGIMEAKGSPASKADGLMASS
jgi:N-acetylglucosaminyl-diphospho-decaprenol L-rhamnosyltransferase